MSIQREYDWYRLTCDICQNAEEETFNLWRHAVEYAKLNGWKQKHEGGGWIDICPDCQE